MALYGCTHHEWLREPRVGEGTLSLCLDRRAGALRPVQQSPIAAGCRRCRPCSTRAHALRAACPPPLQHKCAVSLRPGPSSSVQFTPCALLSPAPDTALLPASAPWHALPAVHERLHLALSLPPRASLTSPATCVSSVQHDMNCLLAWGPHALVIAFRGTQSLANVKADAKVGAVNMWCVWRTVATAHGSTL